MKTSQQNTLRETRKKHFPTLESTACHGSTSKQFERDLHFSSPPTLPYTIQDLQKHMNANKSAVASKLLNQDEIKVELHSAAKGNKSASSSCKINGLWLPMCTRTYGHITQCTVNTTGSESSLVPDQEILRWKEFRRKQKEHTDYDRGNECDERQQPQLLCENINNPSIGCILHEEMPQLGSLSLSASDSSSIGNVKQTTSTQTKGFIDNDENDMHVDRARGSLSHSSQSALLTPEVREAVKDAPGAIPSTADVEDSNKVRNVSELYGEIDRRKRSSASSESDSIREDNPIKIDDEGFLFTPTLTTVEDSLSSSFIHKELSNEKNDPSNNAVLTSECDSYVKQQNGAVSTTDMPKIVTSNTILSRLLLSATLNSNECISYDKANNEEETRVNVPSDTLTEHTSNTARFVAAKSSLLAQRIMMQNNNYEPNLESTSSAASPNGDARSPSLLLNTPLTESTVTRSYDVTPISSSRERPDATALRYSSSSQALPLRICKEGEAMEVKSWHCLQQEVHERNNSVIWDDTRTTLDPNQLEGVLSTPLNRDCSSPASIERNNDISMVSSNWDPLHITTIQEFDEEILNEDGTNINCNNRNESCLFSQSTEIENNIVEDRSVKLVESSVTSLRHPNQLPLISSTESPNIVRCKTCTKESGNSQREMPTMSEVKNFLDHLERLQNVQASCTKSISTSINSAVLPQSQFQLPMEKENEIVVKEENVEFIRVLLDKKEKLRQHKIDSDRKKQEFENRIKAMRSKFNDANSEMAPKDKGSLIDSKHKKQVSNASIPKNDQNMIETQLKKQECEKQIEDQRFKPSNDTVSLGASGNLIEENDDFSFTHPVPGAKWSGGLARWTPLETSHPKPITFSNEIGSSVLKQGTSAANHFGNVIAVNREEDDYSFRPSVTAYHVQIPFSPLVAGSKSISKFNFSSLEVEKSLKNKIHDSNICAVLTTNTTAVIASPPSLTLRSSSKSLIDEVDQSKIIHETPSDTSLPVVSISPAVSEGDKGGGFEFNLILGDKSVDSKSSSKFVELGGIYPCNTEEQKEEEQGLLGVTVVRSKGKKNEMNKKVKSPVFETVDELSKGESAASIDKTSVKHVAPDPPGVESCSIWRRGQDSNSSHGTNKSEPQNDTVTIAQKNNDFDSIMLRVRSFNITPKADKQSDINILKDKHSKIIKTSKLIVEANSDEKLSKINMKINDLKSKVKLELQDVSSASEDHIKAAQLNISPKTLCPQRLIEDPRNKNFSNHFEERNSSSAFAIEGLSIRELRSIFESSGSCEIPMAVENSNKAAALFQNSVLQSKTSLESDADGNDGADGELSLDTRKVLLYAQDLEQRSQTQTKLHKLNLDDAKSRAHFEETDVSLKENIHERSYNNATDTMNNHLPTFSPVAIRKKVFENTKKSCTMGDMKPLKDARSSKPTTASTKKLDASSEIKNIDILTAAGAAHKNINDTPIHSVKDIIANFSATSRKSQTMTPTKTSIEAPKKITSFEKQTFPHPHMIELNDENPTPSPLGTINQSNYISPNAPRCYQKQSPLKLKSSPFAHAWSSFEASPNRKQSILSPHVSKSQGRYPSGSIHIPLNSPSPHCQTEEDDGITLSPTFSEVSGLTLPTCLRSAADESASTAKKLSTVENLSTRSLLKPTYCDTMSPIARHRQKKRLSQQSGSIAKHPYVQRLNSCVNDDTKNDFSKNFHTIPTPKARSLNKQDSVEKHKISHREQILSRIRDKPVIHKRTPPITVDNAADQTFSSMKASHFSQFNNHAPHKCNQGHEVLQPHEKIIGGKGKVAERVALVNQKMHKVHLQNNHKKNQKAFVYTRKSVVAHKEDQSSAATRDCFRVN